MAMPPFFGSEILVNTTIADTQLSPSVTALANGKFIAVWGDDLLAEVRGQLYNGDGTRAGSEFLVSQEDERTFSSVLPSPSSPMDVSSLPGPASQARR